MIREQVGAADTCGVDIARMGRVGLVWSPLRGGEIDQLVLAKHQEAPDTWRAPLMAELD